MKYIGDLNILGFFDLLCVEVVEDVVDELLDLPK
jgi:hypothetical protein